MSKPKGCRPRAFCIHTSEPHDPGGWRSHGARRWLLFKGIGKWDRAFLASARPGRRAGPTSTFLPLTGYAVGVRIARESRVRPWSGTSRRMVPQR